MPRRHLQALILQVKDYRESSIRVSFFTREEGRLSGIVKGYKGRRRQRHLAPFQAGALDVAGASSLATVTGFEADTEYPFAGDQLAAGFYVYELITRGLVEHQAEPGIYDAVSSTFGALLEGSHIGMVLRTFELYLLDQLGFGVDFGSEAVTGKPIQELRHYVFVPELGFQSVPEDVAGSLSGQVVQSVGQREFATMAVLKAARLITQAALRPVVGDEPLISRHLLKAGSAT